MVARDKTAQYSSQRKEEKQEKYPTAIYVRDFDKVLVKKWGIADDNSDVVAFDKKGNVLFIKEGKLGPEDIKKLVQLIRENLDK